MQYRQITVSSLLNKITNKDKLFGGDYTIDPYQNCEFGCSYCDSSTDNTIYVKTNVAELLKKELKKFPKGVIIVGSVHDPYQKAEKNFKNTRTLLEIIKQNGFSCHILTKSDLILRDIDILAEFENCTVTMSIISTKSSIQRIFEKNVISSKKRLQTIEKLKDKGIKAGLAIIPILPFIVEEEFEVMVKSAKKHKAKYILHKHLELKGDQKIFFMKILEESYPDLVEKYKKLYLGSYEPNQKYISEINETLEKLLKKYDIKNKIDET